MITHQTIVETIKKEVKKHCWSFDSVDCISNFVHGLNQFEVSIILSIHETTLTWFVLNFILGKLAVAIAIEEKATNSNGKFVNIPSLCNVNASLLASKVSCNQNNVFHPLTDRFSHCLSKSQRI